MGDDELRPNGEEGVLRWFSRKLVTAPAFWLGLVVAVATGSASRGAGIPVGGAIGLGVMVGGAVGALGFLLMHGISTAHRRARESGIVHRSSAREAAVIESLRRSGREDDAGLLARLFEDRDALAKRAGTSPASGEMAPLLELVSSIATEACRQAEELDDLARRMTDPLLTAPENAGVRVESIRRELRAAYRAVADVRSVAGRCRSLEAIDFLGVSDSLEKPTLGSLTRRLEEESSISGRVARRLEGDLGGGVVLEETSPEPESGHDGREIE